MTPIRAIAVVAALAWGAFACSSSPSIDGARQSWKRTVETCPTYHYAITDSGVFLPTTRTTIVISDGQPIARGYVESQYRGSGLEVTASWTEQAGHVGEHAQGRPAKTMEQLQDDCALHVLVQDRTKYEVKLSADDRGVVLECWYYPIGCEDCSIGGFIVEDFACGTLVLADVADGGAPDAPATPEAGQPQDAGADG